MTAKVPWGWLGVGFLLIGVGLGVGAWCGVVSHRSEEEAERATPAVITAVRHLARLEAVSFHLERVIDLRDRQSLLWGLVEAEDAVLLVAAGEVVAGVDLRRMREGDVQTFPSERRAVITLPAPEILWTRLDNEVSFVHSRKTDLLARRKANLETRARQRAERTLYNAAIEGGILGHARRNAAATIEALVRSLGYETVEVHWARD